jgi:alpha-acetolactate decarboxylase
MLELACERLPPVPMIPTLSALNLKEHRTSLMSALIAGVYEGEATYGQIRKYGDFGLGTFNDLDGEMVGFDGTFYQLRSDGSARPSRATKRHPSQWLPFSSRSWSWM